VLEFVGDGFYQRMDFKDLFCRFSQLFEPQSCQGPPGGRG
jgi:hypothetical protein